MKEAKKKGEHKEYEKDKSNKKRGSKERNKTQNSDNMIFWGQNGLWQDSQLKLRSPRMITFTIPKAETTNRKNCILSKSLLQLQKNFEE
jgi:hypothetical protein